MSKTISAKTRVAAVKDYVTTNATLREVAANYNISFETLRRWVGNKVRPRGKNNKVTNTVSAIPVSLAPKRKYKSRRTAAHTNSSKRWSKAEDSLLRDAVDNNYTVKQTVKILGRTPSAIYCRKSQLINDGFFKNKKARFSTPKGSNRKSIVKPTFDNPIVESVITTKKVNKKQTNTKGVAYNDLARIVKDYGLSVTISITESGTEVKMHS